MNVLFEIQPHSHTHTLSLNQYTFIYKSEIALNPSTNEKKDEIFFWQNLITIMIRWQQYSRVIYVLIESRNESPSQIFWLKWIQMNENVYDVSIVIVYVLNVLFLLFTLSLCVSVCVTLFIILNSLILFQFFLLPRVYIWWHTLIRSAKIMSSLSSFILLYVYFTFSSNFFPRWRKLLPKWMFIISCDSLDSFAILYDIFFHL